MCSVCEATRLKPFWKKTDRWERKDPFNDSFNFEFAKGNILAWKCPKCNKVYSSKERILRISEDSSAQTR